MLKSLKFVSGAINKKDYVQALSHFRIENKIVRGFSGVIGISCPIALDLDITPNAEQFTKAIQTCQDTIGMHVTKNGKLSIKSGNFKALVNCIEKESFPEILPDGEFITLNGGFLATIKRLAPFIGDDASRSWARGILFRGQSAFATNNIILVESWLGYKFPVTVNIPKAAIVELLRINEEPERLQVSANRISFHFSGDRWLCSQTYSTEWPDLSRVLNNESNAQPMPEGMFEAVESLAPFTDQMERVFFSTEGKISTVLGDEDGASMLVEAIKFEGCYNYKHLMLLKNIAQKMDFTLYPGPCLFFGDKIRGALIGLRL
jgi:DNA polymerase III sliding clamp (beta) subunit (PCNA family)